jgi:hypothetical protein
MPQNSFFRTLIYAKDELELEKVQKSVGQSQS